MIPDPSDEPDIPDTLDPEARRRLAVLLGSILLIALCSITYELIIGTLSSYLLGNSVLQFSVIIGLYMSAMGVGSFLSRFIKTDLLLAFFWVEIGVGVLGGFSAAALFGIFVFSPYFQWFIWIWTFAIGILVGLEIPLLARYVRRYSELRNALSNVLSWDYIGALAGSLAFPLLLLPRLGLLNTAAAVGIINLLVAFCGIIVFRNEIKRPAPIMFVTIVSGLALTGLLLKSADFERFLDRRLFSDTVVYKEQTPYQKLTVTAWNNDIRLYINNNIQFSSADEFRYHEALVVPAMAANPNAKNVAILGGGDGLISRQLLKYPDIERIVMVDLDPRMTELAAEHPALKRVNQGAMEDPRLNVINDDAMAWLQSRPELFDVIFIDLPDPNNEGIAKLYSVEFYRLVRQHLAEGGVAVTQSTSVYYSNRSFWSIHVSMEASFCPEGVCDQVHVVPYHVWVPSFGDWGFNLASTTPLDPTRWDFPKDVEYMTQQTFANSLYFTPDIAEPVVKPNRLIEPVILDYYMRDWQQFHP